MPVTRLHQLAAVLLLWALPQAAVGETSPSAVVEQVNASLLGVMQDAETLGFEGRRDQLEPVLAESFNFAAMARIAAGRHWRDLSEPERDRLGELFAQRSVADFAARFDGFSGERFEVLGEEELPRGNILVKNQIVKGSGEALIVLFTAVR